MKTIKIPELEAKGFTEFDPNDLPEHASIGITAMRRSGKTVLVQPIIEEIQKRFDEAYIFSTTCDLLQDDYKFIPSKNKYNHVNLEKIQEIITRQENIIKFNNTCSGINKIRNNVLILMDDCIQDNKSRSKLVDGLYTRGRHIKVSVILLSQMYKNTEAGGFKKTCRMNCDVLISFVQPNYNDRKSFVEENLSIIDKKEGMVIFDEITKNEYCAIVINLHKITTARSYKDYVQYIKIDTKKKIRNFKIEKKENFATQPVKENKYKKGSFEGYGKILI